MTAVLTLFSDFRPGLDSITAALVALPITDDERAGFAVMIAGHALGTAVAAMRLATGLQGSDADIARQVADLMVAGMEAYAERGRQ